MPQQQFPQVIESGQPGFVKIFQGVDPTTGEPLAS